MQGKGKSFMTLKNLASSDKPDILLQQKPTHLLSDTLQHRRVNKIL